MSIALPIKLGIQSTVTWHYCTTLAIHFLLICSFFFMPISLSLKSIFLPITAGLLMVYYRHQLISLLKAPWAWATLLLFLLVCVDCLRGSADWTLQSALIHKYSKLLYLPIIALGLQEARMRMWAMNAFLAAMLVTLCCSLLKMVGLLEAGLPNDPGSFFHNHIATGYFMAFAAFLSANSSMNSTGKVKLVYIGLTVLFTLDVLFINTGRTGYVIFALMVLLFVLHFIRHSRYLLLMIPVVCILGWQSTVLTSGIRDLFHEREAYSHNNKNTSLGYRLQFHDYARTLYSRNPINGLGTGEFMNRFVLEKPMPHWRETLNQPHSEYWLIASEHGLVGLSIFLFFFMSLFYMTFQLRDMRLPMQGLLLSFLLGCSADAWLFVSPTGFFMVMFAAMGAGEWLGSDRTLKKDQLQ